MACWTDPTGFIDSRRRPVFLDEVQRRGDPLILAIKAAVDRAPTQVEAFVLAGSSRFLTVPTLSESPAGRARIIDLWPFSQSELEGTDSRLLDELFDGVDPVDRQPVAESRQQTMERVVRGGFPNVVQMSTERLRRGLLETIYLYVRIPTWSTNRTARAKKRPKIHIVDSAMAADLNGLTVDQLSDPLCPHAGAMLESFVANEVIRLAGWSDLRVGVYHFRDREGREVDLVLEAPDGRIIGIDVKAAVDVDEHDFRWLAYLRDRHVDLFVQGLVMHHGRQPVSFGDRLTAVPISALWSG